jgi:hypothetical protein
LITGTISIFKKTTFIFITEVKKRENSLPSASEKRDYGEYRNLDIHERAQAYKNSAL